MDVQIHIFCLTFRVGAACGLKLTAKGGCVGLPRESVNFPDIQKVETLILMILGLQYRNDVSTRMANRYTASLMRVEQMLAIQSLRVWALATPVPV